MPTGKVGYELSTYKPKYFMCEKCYRTIYGYYSSVILFEKDFDNKEHDDLDLDNIKVYKDTSNHISVLCPYCNDEDANMFEIDEYMINPIRTLNQKGYYTKFCCEGHVAPKYADIDEYRAILKAAKNDTVNYSVPYIWFDWGRISSQMFYRMMENTKEPYEDFDFFYFDLQREFTLFKTSFIQSKQGLIYPPEGWKEDMNIYGHDHQVDAIYYRKDDIDRESLNDALDKADLVGVVTALTERIDVFGSNEDEKVKNMTKSKTHFLGDSKEDYINGKLMTWVNNLPDLTKIYTKDDILKAFDM